jgi:formylglycine-generating enzyme required for sulfatase activity
MRFPGWILRTATVMAFFCGLLNAGEPATAIASVTAGFVTAITVTSGGSKYTVEPVVTLTGGGGNRASAKAILAGDKVDAFVVLTAGSEYTAAPTVVVDAPPKPLGVKLEMVPKLTVDGPSGSSVKVEWSETAIGTWTTWTNVTVGADGTVLVDLTAGSATRFYRTVPVGPPGFVWIKPGTFLMGSPSNETDRNSDEFMHTVTLTQGFCLSDHEVTQAEYLAVMGNNPSKFKGMNLPVESVSWDDAVAYCQRLTERERTAGRITAQQVFRLPTEAEWEYAARAGTTGPRYGDFNAIAWHGMNSGGTTHEVYGKKANPWGLYDMIGNVWEWCSDWYGGFPTSTDPTGASIGSFRIYRGGGFTNDAGRSRSAYRGKGVPNSRNDGIGFRPVLSAVR